MAIHSNQRKRSERNPDWKRSKTLLADDMILYTENTKDVIRKLPALINEYSKVAGYKVNTWKSLGFLYTNKEKSERKLSKQSHCKIKNKIPRNKPFIFYHWKQHNIVKQLSSKTF